MAQFEFVTDWYFDAPLALVWGEIAATDRWPQWWPGVERVECLRAGNENGVGFVYRYTMRGALPYRVRFDMETVAVEPLHTLEGVARGEVVGVGRWQFLAHGAGTRVRYFWYVRLTGRLMRVLSTLAAPVFAWNHDVVMRRGERALAQRLHKLQQLSLAGRSYG